MVDFYERVLSVLRADPRFFAEDGTFLRNAVYEAAMQMDAGLLRLLLGDAELSRRFFTEVDGIRIFDKMKFAWVVNNRQFLPDSYTRFKNKIGLGEENGELLSASGNVELVFPYKDCVLEGGQTKEEARRQEIFYNETLAPDEVDRLLEPKVLTGAKRYAAQGVQETDTWSEEDNLILKGNNLLALSSLLKRYEGKVKCIYIDPPYYFTAKKGEDTFAYNSNFKLSTWLVFMKNRLELARRLLREDGAIFVQISDDGVAELKCLMKDIFCRNGENNFINQITVRTKSPSGFASVNPGVFETAEYILAFAKNKRLWKYNPQYVKSEYDSNYKWLVTNPEADPSHWNIVDLFAYVAQQQGYESRKEAVKALGEAAFLNLVERCALDHAEAVFRATAIDNSAGQEIVQAREQSREERDRIFTVERDGHYRVFILNGAEMAFYSRKVREIDGERVPSTQLTNIWTDTPYEGIAREGGVQLKGGKKPEKLLRRILEMATVPGDLVLDFYMGSGTTCAVAHKLGRRYIGVEQLDGQLEKALNRLPAVIAGEQTGISKAVGWKGGGSFVCCELAKLNQAAVEAIAAARDKEELAQIRQRILDSGYVSYQVDPAMLNQEAASYEELTLAQKKQFLMEILDKNLLYVNACDLDDTEFGVCDADKRFTRSFYGEE